eukprot:scaffold5296_cov215-Cylindrotheca_fusiformis.AAC.10
MFASHKDPLSRLNSIYMLGAVMDDISLPEEPRTTAWKCGDLPLGSQLQPRNTFPFRKIRETFLLDI